MRRVTFENHVLLCGWLDRSREILKQLFAPDLKEHSPVVIIDPNIEDVPFDHPLLRTVHGDPTNPAVLQRANASKARAAIILANRESGNANDNDARSLLIALAIETLQPRIYSCVSDGKIVNSHRSRWQFRQGDRVFVLSEQEPKGIERVQPES